MAAGSDEMDLDTFYRAVLGGDEQTVRRGLEAGVDVNVKIGMDKETHLHRAAYGGHTGTCELLIRHGAAVNACDQDQYTPLHWAAGRGHTGTCELLIRHGADVTASDELFQYTPLHRAAYRGHTGTCELLIRFGADMTARNKDGKTPLDLVGLFERQMRRVLKDAMQEKSYHELLQKSGGVKVNRCKVFVFGMAETGKSTLKKSLRRGPVTAFFQGLSKPSSEEEPHDPTPGVDVGTFHIPGVGEVSLWDFAGQAEYAVTHSMFMDAENTVFIVLYNIMDDSEEQERKVHWWLSFIKSCNPNRQPDIILVASHADKVSRDRGQRKAAHLLQLMTSEFKDHLHISDEVFLMNCKETRTADMDRLKKLLATMKKDMLEHQRQMPKLCAKISKQLPSWCQKKCSPKCPVLRWPGYVEAVKEIDPHVEEDFLLKTTKFIDHLGEVIFKCPSSSDPIIVLKPNWLCTDVIGPMMAPVSFPIPRPERTSEDYVTRAEIQRVFQDVADVDLLITLLQEFQLCHSYDGQTFIFPGLLTQTMPSDKWQPIHEPKVVYFGKQVQCADSTDMFSSGFFPRVQTRLMRELENRPLLWRDGAKCADRNVEGLIKLSPDSRAVNICVRSAQGDKGQCGKMLQQLENIIADVLDECSPGTGTVEKVLSALALKEHMEEFYSYGKEEISKAAAEGGTIIHPTLGFTEQVSDLLCGEDEDPRLQGLVNYCDKVTKEVSNEWDLLALKLGFNDNEIGVIRDLKPDQDHRCREMLTRWKDREGREATLQVLKEALKEIGQVRVAEILDVDVKDYFDTVIKEASNDWDDLALKLGFNYNEIGVIRDLKPDQDRRCREMLHRWSNREGSGATLQVLKQALIEIDLGRVAESFME
ncbi:death-associated protein kinase 1-like [Branchiostoma floridae x Branchiostoma japonicum]